MTTATTKPKSKTGLLTAKALARFLVVTESTVYRWAAQRPDFPRAYFKPAEVQRWLKRHEHR